MTMTTSDILAQANTGLGFTQDLQSYFNNFLTVQTFGGDYMFQRLVALNNGFNAIIADAQMATPNTSDIEAQVTTLQGTIAELIDYDTRFLTVQTFGGNYLTERLGFINQAIIALQAA